MTQDENRPVIVFSGNATDAQMIKIYLESMGIQAFVQDEMSGTLAPFATSPGGIGAVKVVVAMKNLDEAKKIVQDFLNNLDNE